MTEALVAKAPETVRLALKGLEVSVPGEDGMRRAVLGIDLEVRERTILGLVGESGSGKSLTVRAIAGILDPGVEVTGGEIEFEGDDLRRLTNAERRSLSGGKIGIVFQDSMAGLNPVQRIGAQIEESLLLHTDLGKRQRRERVVELLRRVGVPAPESRAKAYPHEFSGGMRQRALIAVAIAASPELLIADEATTA